VGSGRTRLVAAPNDITAVSAPESTIAPTAANPRLSADLINDLWTAVRRPEARFVTTDAVPGYPAIVVPGNSHIEYSMIVSPGSHLRFAHEAQGDGTINFSIKANDEILYEEEVPAHDESLPRDLTWKELDLSPWAGQGVVLALQTSAADGEASGQWYMPQIITDASWVLAEPPDDYLPVGILYGDTAELLGVTIDDTTLQTDGNLSVRLLWRPLQENDRHGKVFVHLLDIANQLVAQHDGAPVQGTYPFAIWQPGTIVQDEHILHVDPDALSSGPFSLAVGVYDPDTLQRWTAENLDGTLAESGAAVLELPYPDLSGEVLP
jgi:hypothetical protein